MSPSSTRMPNSPSTATTISRASTESRPSPDPEEQAVVRDFVDLTIEVEALDQGLLETVRQVLAPPGVGARFHERIDHQV